MSLQVVRRTWSPTRRSRASWEAKIAWLLAHRRLWWGDPDHPPAEILVQGMKDDGLLSPETLWMDCGLIRLVRAAHERAKAQHLGDTETIRATRYLAEAQAAIAAALAVLETRVADAEHRVTHARLARRADVLADRIDALANNLTIDLNGWEHSQTVKESACESERRFSRR